MYIFMNRTNSRVDHKLENVTVRYVKYEQDYYRVCKKRTTSRVCKNRTTGPQVEYVRKGPQVEYICKNRTTSKVRMYEQDH